MKKVVTGRYRVTVCCSDFITYHIAIILSTWQITKTLIRLYSDEQAGCAFVFVIQQDVFVNLYM